MTTTASPPLRIAIAQVRMHWTIEGNLYEMLRAMALARDEGAALCLFPELALPGFHRQIVALGKPALIGPAIASLEAACAELGLAIAFGAPTFDASGIRNSYLLLDEAGTQVAAIHKNGLTDPEATFFVRGTDRPVASLCGRRTSAVICREIEDGDHLCAQLQGHDVELLLWPGQMRPDPDKPPVDPPEHVAQAQALARRLGATIVQANWPNALNRPEESAEAGRSAVIGPDGTLLFRAPKAEPGVAVFALGEGTHAWFGSDDRSVARSA